jgi:hypothetical protein
MVLEPNCIACMAINSLDRCGRSDLPANEFAKGVEM